MHDERRYRVFADLERIAGRFPHAYWHNQGVKRNVVIWCSNDYLGMGQHPKVVGAMVETATRIGTGAGGTRNIAAPIIRWWQLEAELADLHGKEASLLFTSATCRTRPASATIAKAAAELPDPVGRPLNHNSMIEGVPQPAANTPSSRHNDAAHLEQLLREIDPSRPKADRLRKPVFDGRRRRSAA